VVIRASPWFGATVKFTVPLPVPLGDEVSASQLASADADHEHSLVVAMSILTTPPLWLTFWFAGPTS
jgi:hypothetical protein